MIGSMKLSKLNNVLLALIILVNGYVIIAPLVPNLLYNIGNHSGQRQQLARHLHSAGSVPVPQTNQLIVPAMLLQQTILEGPFSQQYATLDKGIWRWPKSSTPDKGGNTVLIGHRFTYTNPQGVFYHLDKVKTGDEIGLFWNGKKYLYKVISVTEVPPTDTQIEDQTTAARLTLFTCTPLWLPKNRLVVVASLEAQP